MTGLEAIQAVPGPLEVRCCAPRLVLSLDFELFWGVRDHVAADAFRSRAVETRRLVPRLLEMFADSDVAATWAVVGAMLSEHGDGLRRAWPSERPVYRDASLDAYLEVERAVREPAHAELIFGRELAHAIVETPRQELATHTFSHFYCAEGGGEPELFRADLKAAVRAHVDNFGHAPRSLVFPRNQYSSAHLRVLSEEGIIAFRGNPDSWLYRPQPAAADGILRRSGRLLDALGDVSRTPVTNAREVVPGVVDVPATMLVRFSRNRALQTAMLRRLRGVMRRAASAGAIVHLWFHPHNLSVDVEARLRCLGQVLREFEVLREEFGMKSETMGSVAAEFLTLEPKAVGVHV